MALIDWYSYMTHSTNKDSLYKAGKISQEDYDDHLHQVKIIMESIDLLILQ